VILYQLLNLCNLDSKDDIDMYVTIYVRMNVCVLKTVTTFYKYCLIKEEK